jgi:hypothetical protein
MNLENNTVTVSKTSPIGLILILFYMSISFFILIVRTITLQIMANNISTESILTLFAIIVCYFGLWKRKIWGWKLSVLWYSYKIITVAMENIIRYMNWQEYTYKFNIVLQQHNISNMPNKIIILVNIFFFAFFLFIYAFILIYLYTNKSLFSIPNDLTLLESFTYGSKVENAPEEYCCSNCGETVIIGQDKCNHCGETFEY